MKRGEPPQRKTPLARSTKPLKRTPIKRSPKTPEDRERQRERTARQNKAAPGLVGGITLPEGIKIIKLRAEGRCEVRASVECTGVHEATHHRKSRRFGDHRPENLLASCHNCHNLATDSIHMNPLRAARNGWIVWSYQDPTKIPWVIGP